jgi:hypothetical protein
LVSFSLIGTEKVEVEGMAVVETLEELGAIGGKRFWSIP